MDYLQKKRANTLPKIYKILDDIFYNGNMHGLTVCEAKNLSMVYGDLLFENSSIFFSKKNSRYFNKKRHTCKNG